MRRAALVVYAVTAAAAARADGLDLPLGAGAVARAGANLVAADDATALLGDPAGLARRTGLRLGLGLALAERSASFTSAAAFTPAAPVVASRGGAALLPWGGVALGLADRVVVAAALLQPTALAVDYPTLDSTFDPKVDDRAAAPQRYAATRLRLSRWGLGVGAAVRVLPWLAVGGSALALRTRLESGRVLWAGPAGDGLALPDLSPAYDMAFAADASTWAPAAAGGVVAAPPDLPFELGASVLWQGTASLAGAPALASSRGVTGGSPDVAAAVAGDASARLELPQPLRLRAGARLLLPRVRVEIDAELASMAAAAPSWSVTGVTATPAGGAPAPVTAVPLGPSLESSFSVRGAADVDVVRGGPALLVGYGFARRPQAASGVGPALPDDDTHTLSVGLEGRVDAATVTLGVAHKWSQGRDVQPGDARVLDPIGAVEVSAAAGRVGSAATVVALDVELELL